MTLMTLGGECDCVYSHDQCEQMTECRAYQIYWNLLDAMKINRVTDEILKTKADEWCPSAYKQFDLKSVKAFLKDE